MFFNILATFAEFESDLIRLRTRQDMAVARAKGKLKGKQPKLSLIQSNDLRRMYDTGDYSTSDLSDVFKARGPRSTARWPGSGSPPENDAMTATPDMVHLFRENLGNSSDLLESEAASDLVMAGPRVEYRRGSVKY